MDGKFTTAETPLQVQPQTDWNEEVDDADDSMAHQELSQLQQFLGLVTPKNGKPLEDVVFVCIDCEAFEFDQNKITEIGMSQTSFIMMTKADSIGVSVLDSRLVKDVDPGEDGQPWFDLMQHLHLRPIENMQYLNRRYVKGCPDRFNFGKSAFIPLEDAGRVMDRVFSDPSRIHEACDFDTELSDVAPFIVLIGHDLKNDTDYLKKLDFTPKHVEGKIDTQRLARISKKQPPGLKKLLTALSIDAKNLHNAGNDAAYTLQALIGVAVQEHHHPGEIVRKLKAEKEILDAAKLVKKAKAAELAQARRERKNQSTGNVHPVAGVQAEVSPMTGNQATGQPEASRRGHKSRVRHERQEKDQ